MRVVTHALAIAAAAFVLFVTLAPASAEDLSNDLVVPLPLTDSVSIKREEFVSATQPQLTQALLAGLCPAQAGAVDVQRL